jgi:hypothetical protein
VTSGSALASTCYSKAASGRRRPWVDILIHARPALFKPARRQLARPAVLLDAKALVGVDRRSRLCWCSPRGPDQRSACGRQDDVAKTPRTPIKPVTNPRATAGSKGILVHYSTLRALPHLHLPPSTRTEHRRHRPRSSSTCPHRIGVRAHADGAISHVWLDARSHRRRRVAGSRNLLHGIAPRYGGDRPVRRPLRPPCVHGRARLRRIRSLARGQDKPGSATRLT